MSQPWIHTEQGKGLKEYHWGAISLVITAMETKTVQVEVFFMEYPIFYVLVHPKPISDEPDDILADDIETEDGMPI
jgi:sulfur relay (sulfurtransferase) complex TusBCD TusD component (DsrE family)